MTLISQKAYQYQDLVITATKWLADKIKESPNDGVQELPEVDNHKLKGEQRNVFLQVMAYFKKLKSGDQNQPDTLRLNVHGTAGTGKSFLIWTITTALRELFSDGPMTLLSILHQQELQHLASMVGLSILDL